MRIAQIGLLLIFAVWISILSDVVPKMWVSTQDSDQIRYLGSLVRYQRPCTEKFPNAICAVEYALPTEVMKKSDGQWNTTLGLGFFLTDYALKCDDKLVYVPPTEQSPYLVLDAYKVYKSVDLAGANCQNGTVLSVLALNHDGIVTHGQLSSNAVIGERDHVSALKRTIEFLSSGIYLLIALVLIFSVFELRVLLRPLVTSTDSEGIELKYSGLLWAVFSIFKSGLLEIFFLTPSSINF